MFGWALNTLNARDENTILQDVATLHQAMTRPMRRLNKDNIDTVFLYSIIQLCESNYLVAQWRLTPKQLAERSRKA